jgi:hypothetical protein
MSIAILSGEPIAWSVGSPLFLRHSLRADHLAVRTAKHLYSLSDARLG